MDKVRSKEHLVGAILQAESLEMPVKSRLQKQNL